MKKLLVIGGGGYCGSLLVPQLLQEGWEVTVFDILVWYGSDHLPKENPKLKVIQGDVRDVAKVAQACAGQEYVLHLDRIYKGYMLLLFLTHSFELIKHHFY